MSGTWRPNPGATELAITSLVAGAPIRLPDSYLQQLRESDGGEGDLQASPLWISFWSAGEVLELNRGYNFPDWLPGLFGFASDGSGDLLAFDTRQGEPYPILLVPFPLDLNEATVIAPSFDALRRLFGRRMFDD